MLRVVILIFALAAGGVAAWLVLSFQGSDETPVTAAQSPSEEVLVAVADIAQGTKLDAANMRWQDWPEDTLNDAFILRSVRPDAIETLSDTVVRNRFVSGEPILDEKLRTVDGSFMSNLLPSGKRAVALRISAESTAGGFILPNDRVDVLHTVTTEGGSAAGVAMTRALLRNVRVLAIDQSADQDGPSESLVGKTATLELDPEQTELVTTAQASGLLSLSLRSVADRDEVQTIETAGVAATPQPPRQTSRTVQILHGGRSEFVEIR